MSRIYEALQRADLERNIQEPVNPGPAYDSPQQPEQSAPSPTLPRIVRQTVTERIWRPIVEDTPCLIEHGEVVEQFRGLRSRLIQFRQEAPIKTLLISSGMPAEGKSFVSINLSISLARHNGSRILLIDGDLRRPSLHQWLGSVSTPGLSEYLSGTASLSEIMQCDAKPRISENRFDGPLSHLTFIPAGQPCNSSSDLLLNARMSSLVATLAPQFDWIVIDSPPVLAVSDALELARNADAVMLVAREGRTPFSVAQQAQSAFHNSRLLGFVLNGAKQAVRDQGYYYSSYYSDRSAGDLSSDAPAINQ